MSGDEAEPKRRSRAFEWAVCVMCGSRKPVPAEAAARGESMCTACGEASLVPTGEPAPPDDD